MAAEPRKLYKGVKSYDVTSAYPSSCLLYRFPSSESTSVDTDRTFSVESDGTVIGYDFNSEGLGYIGKFRVTNARRKDWVRLCSLQERDFETGDGLNFDQIGLVEGSFTFNAAMPEMQLFLLQYDYDTIEVAELFTHELAPLPMHTRELLRWWYLQKRKGNLGAKLRLNSIIGCWGRSPFKFPSIPVVDEDSARRALAVYNGSDSKKPASLGTIRTWDFRWGVYAVSYTRLLLGKIEHALAKRGCEVLYSDTDSIKFVGDEGNIFKGYNRAVRAAIKDDRLGCFQNESSEYSDGAIFFAKRQYLRSSGGVIGPCLAGVSKFAASEQLAGKTLEDLEGQPLTLTSPMWMVTELPDDRLAMKFLPQKVNARLTLGTDKS